jgi:hypothetical protein
MGFIKSIFGDHQQAEPSPPATLNEFHTWMDDVIALTRLPNNDSMKFAVATVVLEAKELLTKKQAALKLEKGAQNQFAAFVFQDIKAKRIAADEAEAKKAQEEACKLNATSATLEEAIIGSDNAKEAPPFDELQVPASGSQNASI